MIFIFLRKIIIIVLNFNFNMKNFLLLFFLATLIGCSQEPYFEKINSFEFYSTNDTAINFVANFNVFNPNNFDITLNRFEYSVYYDSALIATGFSNENSVLNHNSSNSLNSIINLNFKNLLPYIQSISNSDSIVLVIELEAVVTKFRKNIKRTFTITLNSSEIISNFLSDEYFSETYKIQSTSLKNVTMQTSTFEVLIAFSNTLPIDYLVKNISFNIFDDQTKANKVGSSFKDYNIEIQKDSTIIIPIEVILNNVNIAFSMFGKMMSGNFSYYIDGNVDLIISGSELQLPLKQTVSSSN